MPIDGGYLVSIRKSDIENEDIFFDMIDIFKCSLYVEEPEYFIISGSKEDIKELIEFWNASEKIT